MDSKKTIRQIINRKSCSCLTGKRKLGFLEKLLLYFVIWSAGGATELQTLLYTPKNWATIPVVLICLYSLKKHKIPYYDKYLIWIVFGLAAWGTIGTILNGYSCQYFFLIYNIYLAYVLIKVFRGKLFYYYEKTVTFFSVISLIAFFAVLFVPGLAEILINISVENISGLWESNLLLFGIQHADPEAAFIFPRRNLGFAWEPGRFSVLVVFALFINMMRHKLRFNCNRSFWILLFTLITTQSTTGYICALIAGLLWLYNSKYKQYLVVPVISFVLLLFVTLPFMWDKIVDKFNYQERTGSEMAWYGDREQAFVPQRFEGMFYDILNFINQPIWGYGSDWKNSYVNTTLFPGGMIYCSDGLIQIFSSCGIFVAVFLYWNIFMSSMLLSRCYKYKGNLLFILLFLTANVSYNFFNITIFLCFIFFSFFISKQPLNIFIKRRIKRYRKNESKHNNCSIQCRRVDHSDIRKC